MRYLTIRAVFLVLIAAVASGSANAQRSGGKKPKPLATPPVITGAEIISQAGDYAEPVATPAEKTPAKQTTSNSSRIRDLDERLKKVEDRRSDYDDRQKRVLMNLDILTRAEQRSDSLRKQLFDMIEKENSIQTRLDQIEYDIRPENIERTLQIAGSLRPEEIRENRRKSLAAERTNLQSLLAQVQSTRATLQSSLQKAEQMVEKLRARAEKDIDDSLQKDADTEKNDQQPPAEDQK
jgi:chromosome segregation ATPase